MYKYKKIIRLIINELKDELSADETILFPNPVSHKLYIRSGSIMKKINVFDVSGRIVNSMEINDSDFVLDVINYKKGVYFFEVITGDAAKKQTVLIMD